MPGRILKFVQCGGDLFLNRPAIPMVPLWSTPFPLEFLPSPLEFLPNRDRLITQSSFVNSTNYIS